MFSVQLADVSHPQGKRGMHIHPLVMTRGWLEQSVGKLYTEFSPQRISVVLYTATATEKDVTSNNLIYVTCYNIGLKITIGGIIVIII